MGVSSSIISPHVLGHVSWFYSPWHGLELHGCSFAPRQSLSHRVEAAEFSQPAQRLPAHQKPSRKRNLPAALQPKAGDIEQIYACSLSSAWISGF